MGSVFSSVGTSVANTAASSAVSGATRTTTHGKKGSRQLALPAKTFEIGALSFFSIIIALLFYYIYKKESTFGMDGVTKIIIALALLTMSFVITQSFKLNVIDFLISSEINILCMYLLLCYIGFTYATFSNPFDSTITFMGNIVSVMSDPTYIFKAGFSLLLPIIFFIIPILVLLYDATQSLANALITLGISIAIVYMLYPQNNVVPITGGASYSLFGSSSTCVNSYISYLNPFNIGNPHC